MIGFALKWCDIINQTAFKRAMKDFIFVFNKGLNAFIFKFTDDACTHVNNLFIGIR